MSFTTTLITVALMLAYAIPGFLLIKTKLVKETAIPAFNILLMYVCQPALTIYCFTSAEFTKDLAIHMLIFFAIIFILILLFFGIFVLIFRKKYSDVRYRVYTIATGFSNCAFFGIPILNALLPDHPELVIYSSVFFIVMNILGWTVACSIISQDKRFISIKKIILNPAVFTAILSLPLFIFNIKLPTQINDFITVLSKMTTPLCMIIMGMRLGTLKSFKPLFGQPIQYLIVIVKQVVFPLVALGVVWFLPVDITMKQTIFILSACPIAAVVQSFTELLGEGQDTAANMVLLGTILSIITLPVLLLIPII